MGIAWIESIWRNLSSKKAEISNIINSPRREEISRGIAAGLSFRKISTVIGKAPSTVSREVNKNWGGQSTGQSELMQRHGIVPGGLNSASLLKNQHYKNLWSKNSP